jgi:hypothetical protein
LAFIALVFFWGDITMSRAATFYVSPEGNDAWSGEKAHLANGDGPFATLARAQRALRIAGGGEVVLAAGIYELAEPLVLGPEDSGTTAAPIVYRAAEGAEVRISAGRNIAGFAVLSAPKLLALLPAEARGKVLFTNIKEQGMDDMGAPGDGLPGLELFINDQPLTLARYPNEGYMRVAAVHGTTPIDVRGTIGAAEGLVEYEDERPQRWLQEKEPMALGFWFWDWAEHRQGIAAIDVANKELTLAEPHSHYGYRAGQWFYGFNLFSEIDQPGEWYLDRETGDLFVWPPEDAAKDFSAMVSMGTDIVHMQGVRDVVFNGLVFEGARRHGLVLDECERVRVEKSVVRNVGSWAVRASGGREVEIVGCDISGTGDGGIALEGGQRSTLTPAKHRAANNHIHHYSRWNRTYKPGISLHGVGLVAARNLIHHAPHEAIAFGGNDMLIEGNEIHNVSAESNDAGAIYALRDWSMRGHIIRYNYLHHLYGHEGKGCHGVYLDDNFSSAHVYGNIFVQARRPVLFGGGRDNILENNIFYQCDQALHIDARGLGWRAYGREELTKKLEEMPYREEPWRSRYPQLLTLLEDEPMTPKGTVVARNIFFGGQWANIQEAAQPYVRFADNLIDVDPLFVDAENGDFNLRDDSPALARGFVPIPLDKIGLYNGPERASWPVEHAVTKREFAHQLAREKAVPRRVAQVPQRSGGEGVTVELAESPQQKSTEGPAAIAQIAHDGNMLYVAVEVPVKMGQDLKSAGSWGSVDGVEVCLRRHDARTPGRTIVVQVLPDGSMRVAPDTFAPGQDEMRHQVEKQIEAKSAVGKDGWTASLRIPLAAIGLEYAPGAELGFNIGVRRLETDEWICWTGTRSQNWQLDQAGRLMLE